MTDLTSVPPLILGLGAATLLACLLALWLGATLAATRRALAAERARRTEDQSRAEEEAERREIQIRELREEAEATARRAEDLAADLGDLREQNAAHRTNLEAVRRTLEEERATRADLATRHTEATNRISELMSENSGLKTALDKDRTHHADALKRMQDMQAQMDERFRELSETSVRTQGEALTRMSGEKLDTLLKPFRETISKLETELRQVHKDATTERSLLKQEITQLTERSRLLSEDAQSLTKALRGDSQKQGAWGEMILSRLLESSGLLEGTHYDTQTSTTTQDGNRLRPDVVVRLPEDRKLVIDSKVSLRAYEQAIDAADTPQAEDALKRHVADLRRHIDGLSAKGYQTLDGGGVDYVVMFIPIEGALSDALRLNGDLTTYALERHVTIATPTTLMMALRTINHVWRVETRNRNAEDIALEAGRLYDKLAGFTDTMEKIGKALDSARDAHAKAVGQLSTGRGNALAKAEKIREMGAKTSKPLAIAPDPDTVEPVATQALAPPVE